MSFIYYEDPILGKGRAADVSGGTGGTSYVAGDGIAINGNTISATGGGGDVTEAEFKDLSDGTQSVSKDVKQARFVEANPWSSATTQNAFTLLHFSDIHADVTTLNRIVAEANALAPNIDAMICTGDMREMYSGEIASWWNPDVLTCIGNHETRNEQGTSWTALSMANRDAYYIAPFQSHWGTIVHTAGTSYYYKDWASKNIRLIVIDCVLYNTTNPTPTEAAGQTAWLTDALADAITKGLHVIIAAHAIYQGSVNVPCSFSKYKQPYQRLVANTQIPLSVVQLVAEKIAAGLKFVGYICGHYHQDGVWDALGDGTQLMYAVTCAGMTPAYLWQNYSDQYRGTEYDAFNLITVDTTNYRMKIVRGGGANVDTRMRKRDMISVEYDTNTIIDEEIPDMQDGFRAKFENGVGSVARYIDTETITGTTVALQAGHAYTANVNGTITLNIETPPTFASYGLDGLLDLNLSGGTVQAGENVYLADTLTANSRNICAVRFIDGIAVVNVITVISEAPFDGYVVTVTSGTSDGSLYYGLATSTETNVGFKSSISGQTVSFANAVTNGEKNIVGRGYSNTILTGVVSCASATTVSNLSLSGVSILGGTMTILDGNVPADASVTVVGYADLRLVSGGGTLDMTGHAADNTAGACFTSGGSACITGITFSNATGIRPYIATSAEVTLNSCTFSNNSSGYSDCGFAQDGGSSLISGCSFTSNVAVTGNSNFAGAGLHVFGGGITTVTSCAFTDNDGKNGQGALTINLSGTSDSVITNCEFSNNVASRFSGALYATGSGNISVHGCTFGNNTKYGSFTGAAGIAFGYMTSASISSCVFSACNGVGGGGAMGAGGISVTSSAHATITDCVFSACIGYGTIDISSNGSAAVTDCIISGCTNGVTTTAALRVRGGSVVDVIGTTVTQNLGMYPILVNESGTIANISNSIISGGQDTDLGVTGSAKVNILGGCNIDAARTNNGGVFNIGGLNNSFTSIDNTGGTGTVNISGGATIFLTSSIAPGANRITVLTGGCVVNGATIAAGTYTSIVSSGGSAVAS